MFFYGILGSRFSRSIFLILQIVPLLVILMKMKVENANPYSVLLVGVPYKFLEFIFYCCCDVTCRYCTKFLKLVMLALLGSWVLLLVVRTIQGLENLNVPFSHVTSCTEQVLEALMFYYCALATCTVQVFETLMLPIVVLLLVIPYKCLKSYCSTIVASVAKYLRLFSS
ncbi:hypothetical protein L1887_03130 [Cichorium endivia]|nr:hypothetical protein L1887_03130 [Cichorium endivia]